MTKTTEIKGNQFLVSGDPDFGAFVQLDHVNVLYGLTNGMVDLSKPLIGGFEMLSAKCLLRNNRNITINEAAVCFSEGRKPRWSTSKIYEH